jgi:hypothetical protein
VVEGRGPLGGVERCSELTTWQPWPQRLGPVGAAVRTTCGAGADDRSGTCMSADCFSLAWFDQDFLLILKLKCPNK